MKKIVLMSLLMLSAAFSQLRVGADVSREMTLGGLEGEKAEGMGDEKLLDQTTDEITNFIDKANLEKLS